MFKLTQKKVVITGFVICSILDGVNATARIKNQSIFEYLEHIDLILVACMLIATALVLLVIFSLDCLEPKLVNLIKRLSKYNYKSKLFYSSYSVIVTIFTLAAILQH